MTNITLKKVFSLCRRITVCLDSKKKQILPVKSSAKQVENVVETTILYCKPILLLLADVFATQLKKPKLEENSLKNSTIFHFETNFLN